jgi:hypothetical protein
MQTRQDGRVGLQGSIADAAEDFGVLGAGLLTPELVKETILESPEKWALINADVAPFNAMMAGFQKKNGLKATKVVNTWSFKTISQKDTPRMLTVTVASSGTKHNTFGVPNSEAVYLNENDVLHFPNTFSFVVTQGMLVSGQVTPTTGGVLGTNVGPDTGRNYGKYPSSVFFSRSYGAVVPDTGGMKCTTQEQVLITNVGEKDSAGEGHTLITVQRCYYGIGAFDIGGAFLESSLVNTSIAANEAGAKIEVGDKFAQSMSSFPTGSGYPTSFFGGNNMDENYIQIAKGGFECEREAMDISSKLYKAGTSPLDLHRRLAAIRRVRAKEDAMWFNRKGINISSSGSIQAVFGGIAEYIPQGNKLKYAPTTFSWTQFNEFSKEILNLHGSGTKYLFCGYSLLVMLQNAFASEEKVRWDISASNNFNVEIYTLRGNGVTIKIVPSQFLEERGYASRGFLLDLDCGAFAPVYQEGYEDRVKTDIGDRATERYKEGNFSHLSLARMCSEYHGEVDFSNCSN